MIDIPLQAVANQELSIPLEASRYVITIKETNGVMSATIVRDDETIISNSRIVGDGLVLPYLHQYFGFGNFMLATQGEAMPYFTEFGTTQFLVYLTQAEMEAP